MSFREKMLWVALTAMAGGFGFYFLTLLTPIGKDATPDYFVGLILIILGFVLASMTIAAIAMALRNRNEATWKEDERDRDIHRAGTQAAYYPLLLGVWATGVVFHHDFGITVTLNFLLAIVVMAEFIRLGWQIWLYRKG